jgi:glycosyltransferase involved in cell wall biosynthesis
VIHAVTHAVANALVERGGLRRDSVVIAAPGIELPASLDPTHAGSGVEVIEGRSPTRDHEVADAIARAGTTSSVVSAIDVHRRPRCVVVATPSEGFPYEAMRAFALGIPVVAARTATTTELLEGAATLVDPLATDEFVAATLEHVGDDAARSVSVAAGRARASDYSWDRRASDIVQVLSRACPMS